MSNFLTFANNYFQTKINATAWEGLTDTLKEKWIAEGVRQVLSIENIYLPPALFNAETLDGMNLSKQEILFFTTIVDGSDVEELDNDVATAICEVILEMLNNSDSGTFEKLQRAGVTSINYGNDSVSFKQNNTSKSGNCYVNNYAYKLLIPYIQRSFKIV